MTEPSTDVLVKFSRVLFEEVKQIRERRRLVGADSQFSPETYGDDNQAAAPPNAGETIEVAPADNPEDAWKSAGQMKLAGLAFSGGGIRSATFGLGILQGLADLGFLKKFDYLSTVSGGGYIGSWLAAWIKRQEGGIQDVEHQLHTSRADRAQGRETRQAIVEEEPEPIRHLRSYSNYLAPRLGIRSLDEWALLAIYARNWILTLCELLPLLLGVLLLPRLPLLFLIKSSPLPNTEIAFWLRIAVPLLLVLCLGLPLVEYVRSRWSAAGGWKGLSLSPDAPPADSGRIPEPITLGGFKFVVIPSLVLASFLASWPRFYETAGITFHCWTMPMLFCSSATFMIALLNNISTWRGPEGPVQKIVRGVREIVIGMAVAVAGGALLDVILQYLSAVIDSAGLAGAHAAAITLTVAPPVCLLVVALVATIHVGIMGQWLNEAKREWWASACGGLLIGATIWAGVGSVALFSVPFLQWAGPVLQTVLGTSWVVTSLSGVIAGRSPKTGGEKKSLLLEVLARVAAYVFLVGLLIALSASLSYCLDGTKAADLGYWEGVANSTWFSLFIWLGGCLLVPLFVAWGIGVNKFSLQKMYQNRLVRCYLGASRHIASATGGGPRDSEPPPRTPNPVTGFDPADDPKLRTLCIPTTQRPNQPDQGAHAVVARPGAGEKLYSGPYVLVNTAMNLAQADELAWQERKAEAFVFSPLYYGSEGTDYVDTARDDSFNMGTAMAISGAAVSPNMGYHSSPAVTALLTFFNLRLGAWIQNPKHVATWGYQWPWWTLCALLSELFGLTNRHSRYVYLSDGGHFENLGVYELVRRHCRYIVAVDAGEDGEYAFEDLGGLIRKCRIDFGVPIEIDVTAIQRQARSGRSRRHYVTGQIRYDRVDPQAKPGTLVYIKCSLTGNEPADVLNYAVGHPEFPHESTLDQFFGESQFESYRALGHHVASEFFA